MDDACHKHPGPDFVENIQTGSMLFNTKYIYKQKTGVQKGLAPWAPEKGAVAENHEMVREKNYADLHIGQVPLVKSYMEGVIVQISICSGNTTYSYVRTVQKDSFIMAIIVEMLTAMTWLPWQPAGVYHGLSTKDNNF